MGEIERRGAASAAPLDQVIELIEQERDMLATYIAPQQAVDAERRAAALAELLRRSKSSDAIVNEATLLRLECSVAVADLVDEGQERGEIARERMGPNPGPTFSDLGIDKRRLSEARKIRDQNVVSWFREQIVGQGRVAYEHALRRAYRMERTMRAEARRTPDPNYNPFVRITHKDIRKWRPRGVHSILTDPPYITEDALDLYEELGLFAAHVLPPGGLCVTMAYTPILDQIMERLGRSLTYYWTMAWTFEHGRDFSPVHSHKVYDRWKPTLIYTNGPVRSDLEWFHDHIPVREIEKDLHPWQQSVEGVATLVQRLTLPGETVADPFMGSGTTGIACLNLGRNFLGSDIDKGAVELAMERLL